MEDLPEQVHGPAAASRRPRAVVVAWDMSHNAAGRAYLLADMLSSDYSVLLIGPIFKHFGNNLWPPLRSFEVELRTFEADSLEDFAHSALTFLDGIVSDIVIACKPRMPSLFLALVLKHRLGCPIILDVDDHELSFFNSAPPLTLADARTFFEASPEAADQPFGEAWTRLAESMIDSFETRTVSNVSLQRRFEGTIIRHARNERLAAHNSEVRSRVRAEYGYSDQDKVVLFLGTPRPHKGVFRIADALRRIRNDKLVLCVIGTVTAKALLPRLRSYDDVRINWFPDQPWARLPELIQLADCVCLLQDETSPISQFQVPAKLTDALAVGVPVAITDVPPFADIPHEIATVIRTDQDLDRFLQSIAAESEADGFQQRRRDYFVRELSYKTNRARLRALISQAAGSGGMVRVPETRRGSKRDD
jgi:glycosyltransferase involved in cell wall biosynthesis